LRGLQQRGLTIILTTHYMEEADRLCQRLAIIDHGAILTIDTPAALKRSLPGGHILDVWVRSGTPVGPASGKAAGRVAHGDGGRPSVMRTSWSVCASSWTRATACSIAFSAPCARVAATSIT
jgi:energy-coupling factor transporter ATP-binding protein EcfA2